MRQDDRSETADGFESVRLSTLTADRRARLIARYSRDVYDAAFPDPGIREDPGYWLDLLAADPYPAPPQPLIEVILLVDEAEAVAGGATIELYRDAGCGLLTYIAIAEQRRGAGLGKRLVAEARAALDSFADAATPLFAETERYEDAEDDHERSATVLRQRQLTGLGARMIDFDYVMPPLRTGLPPRHLHLMLIDGPESIEARTVAGLIDELAAALGADLDAEEKTRAMMAWLAGQHALELKPLPGSMR